MDTANKMKNVMITGCAGFIGSNFTRLLVDSRPDLMLVGVDNLTYAGNKDNLKGVLDCLYFNNIDITDKEDISYIMKEFKIDTIVNFAAETHVDNSIINPLLTVNTNVMGTLNLLECAKEWWYKNNESFYRFHQIGTDECYGSLGTYDNAFTEDSRYQPNSPYSASKASADHLVRAYNKTYGLPTSISNCSNNYGMYQHSEKLIPKTITNALKGKPIPIYGDGFQIRDWLYVGDHCKAIMKILDYGASGTQYNIGGNCEVPNILLVREICKILDTVCPNKKPYETLIEYVEDRKGHDYRYAINTLKINQELDWFPEENLESGLYKTITWYYENFKDRYE